MIEYLRVGRLGKPEAYYYPPQMNNYGGNFPHTYFGFDPDVTKKQVRERLLDYENRDIRITELSRAYRIELGTGWYTPPGVVHAPGSYLTYEPQWNSDVNSVFENMTAEGHGRFGVYAAEAAGMLRFGQMSADEYFVSEQAAEKGITIFNESRCEPMVMLKHFGPNHPDMPKAVPTPDMGL